MKGLQIRLPFVLVVACVFLAFIFLQTVVAEQDSQSPGASKDMEEREGEFSIRLWTDENKATFEIGEVISFKFSTTRDCQVTLYAVSPGGKATRLFPNKWQPEGSVRAGKVYSIPPSEEEFRFRVHGPVGTEVVKAIATINPQESRARSGSDDARHWTEAELVFRIVQPGEAADESGEKSSQERGAGRSQDRMSMTDKKPRPEVDGSRLNARKGEPEQPRSESPKPIASVPEPEKTKPAQPTEPSERPAPAVDTQKPEDPTKIAKEDAAGSPPVPEKEEKPVDGMPAPAELQSPLQRPESEGGRIAVEPIGPEEPPSGAMPVKPSPDGARSAVRRQEEPTKQAASPLPGKDFEALALSLRVLQDKLKECKGQGNCTEKVLSVGGMTRVLGYVADGTNKDVVLVGQVEAEAPKLHVEDFIVAIRNAWNGSEPPGCSIDPDPEVMNDLQKASSGGEVRPNSRDYKESVKQWKEICARPQSTRIMGVDPDTRFAHVMIDADYYMKRLVNGSVDLGIDGFKSLSQMTLDLVRSQIDGDGNVAIPPFVFNRFWFSPGDYSFVEDANSAWLKDAKVILLTEEEFLNKTGQIEGKGRPGELAGKFTEAFSNSYSEIGKKKPIYSELESLYRFVALAKVMQYKGAFEETGVPLDYLLAECPVSTTAVADKMPGLSNVSEMKHRKKNMEYFFCLKNCGGVSMDIPVNDKAFVTAPQQVSTAIAADVVSSRPAGDSLVWKVSIIPPAQLWSTK